MDTPLADIATEAALVNRLVEAQHPDLSADLTPIAQGWDNSIYRLGETLCVRLPRREVAVELIRNEQRWLPELAQQLGAPIPAPVRVGVPSEEFPWPWTIAPWFEGLTADELAPADRGALAVGLAAFVTELHTPAPHDAPHNPVRGVPLSHRAAAVRERLAAGTIPRSGELLDLWEALSAAPPWTGPPLWLHGDLHPANLLTDGGELAAVLDFGDLTAGDPATDLAAAWMVFDADARAVFRAQVEADDATWTRARAWALVMGTAVAAHSDDNPRMAALGEHIIGQVAEGGSRSGSLGRR